MGASPRSASPDLALPDNRGRQSTKGYPSSGGVVDPPDSRICGSRFEGYSGVERRPAPVHFTSRHRVRFAIEQRRSVAQIVTRKPVRAVAANLVISFANLVGRNTPEAFVWMVFPRYVLVLNHAGDMDCIAKRIKCPTSPAN